MTSTPPTPDPQQPYARFGVHQPDHDQHDDQDQAGDDTYVPRVVDLVAHGVGVLVVAGLAATLWFMDNPDFGDKLGTLVSAGIAGWLLRGLWNAIEARRDAALQARRDADERRPVA